LGGPSVAQGPCVGLARVESDKCFVFNAADEKGVGRPCKARPDSGIRQYGMGREGEGEGCAKRTYRRHRT
jgi:hypothetical protein